ncbi:S-adenosyl-L-methionine-dependent methyltransferase [Mytilinidion resinicola]|uniref:S-adenosyl-L-methionine-dependent methyltransferase n=1 Tax=Mytilinidion resinicola TaxID=574789 RepID=A0A6A6Z8U7_9PEZI|nr:S-adenosyl-L-methionine-dependent methyltransferase [Mytilinidion resinicola]KAF2817228.1 S-adenosyl-L-methionine-dependent methyltransferase [Mytilinidion resinicola]
MPTTTPRLLSILTQFLPITRMTPPSTATFASAYLRMTGGCTIHLANTMLSFPSLPPITPASYVLDNACGPGVVTSLLKSRHPAARVMAADLAPAMLDEVDAQIQQNGWSGVETAMLDVRNLEGLDDESFTHVFANLALPVPGDQESGIKAAREMFRVVKKEGVVVVSTWADRVWPAAFTSTAHRIRPTAVPQNAMALEPEYLTGSWLLRQLEEGGFGKNVEIKSVPTYTSAATLDKLVENMFMAKGMFFTGFDEEELGKAKVVLKEEMKGLRTFEEVDGGVRVGMRAWVGVGWKRGDEGEVAC